MYQVLVVADDIEINKILAEFLKENRYKTISQYDGRHVLDCLLQNNVDIILLDLMLPYKSGDILLADIRKQSVIPVIIISAKETTQNKIDLLRLGADDYITKPFDMGKVLAHIECNLHRAKIVFEPLERLEYKDLILEYSILKRSGITINSKRICHFRIANEISR